MTNEESRQLDAYFFQKGACNPVAMASTIQRHVAALFQETHSMTAVRQDPALRLMVHQLAHLFNVSEFDTVIDPMSGEKDEYGPALAQCREVYERLKTN
jgi:hypothetical protein